MMKKPTDAQINAYAVKTNCSRYIAVTHSCAYTGTFCRCRIKKEGFIGLIHRILNKIYWHNERIKNVK